MRQPVPFGKYLLLDRISVGGMAEVFKAKSYGVEGFEKIIAIKRILPTMGEDRDFIKMFIDEAKIAGQLAHANICQIFELGRIDGSHFIAMEYIWGKDLLQIQNRLRKIKQAMPIAMACFCIAKVLEGLDYAHRKRDPLGRPLEIVHRDCSPQNVLVSYEGEVKVIDFGIAKATSRNSRTMAGVLKGKFGYMLPEQVRGLPLDRRSDIFALGTMLYECLAGDRLFQGETDFSTLEKVRNVDIRPPREVNPNIPVAVEQVIMKALAKDVEERYQWCSEMLADLQAFLMSQDVVFTAKSLSSWLKEVFSGEIDRERQQLEQYKRVGRDGLIAGVPAAESKADVVENFGEAGQAEGDPTMLGGPNFEDIEHAAGAAPEVGPAPGSPATRAGSEADEDNSEDFGEEAPTEIFGEIDHGANPAAALAASPSAGSQPLSQPLTRPPKPPPNRAPTSRGDIPSLMPPGVAAGGHASPGSAGRTPAPVSKEMGPTSFAPGPAPSSQTAVPSGPQVGPASSQPIALGTPGAVPVMPFQANGQPAAAQGQGRTLIGQQAPAGLPNYAQGYPPPQGPAQGHPGQPHPGQPQQGQPGSQGQPQGQAPTSAFGQPSGPNQPQLGPQAPTMMAMQAPPGYPGGPHPQQPHQPHGSHPQYGPPNQGYGPPNQGYGPPPNQGYGPPQNQGYGPPQNQGYGPPPNQGYGPPQNQGYGPPQNQGYGSPQNQGYGPPNQGYGPPNQAYGGSDQYNVAAPPVEQAVASDGKKRSSIARDVAIGVAIAALVLGGFLAVKFLILDGDGSAPEPTQTYATVKPMLSGGEANLFVDDKLIAVARDKQEFQVGPGHRRVKLVARSGAACERETTLVAGKTFILDCALGAAAPGSGSAKSGSATGGPAAADGSAAAVAPAAGSGSAGAGAAPAGGSAAGSGSSAGSAVTAGAGGATGAKADAPDHAVPDKADRMPAEDTAKQDRITDQGSDKPPRAVQKPTEKSADKPPDKARSTERPSKSAAIEDDLGMLKGGVKPGDKKPMDARTDGDAKGYLTAVTRPISQVFIDGNDTGLTTPISGRALSLAPGKHKVVFVYAGGKLQQWITVKPGETVALNKDLR